MLMTQLHGQRTTLGAAGLLRLRLPPPCVEVAMVDGNKAPWFVKLKTNNLIHTKSVDGTVYSTEPSTVYFQRKKVIKYAINICNWQ